MNLHYIRTFLSVARHLNYSRAAEELFISQSSVTKQIQSLEDELGFKLLNRNRNAVQLTYEGRIMLDAFLKMTEVYEADIKTALREKNENRIIVNYPSFPYWMNLPELLAVYTEKCGVRVSTKIGRISENLPSFLRNEADVIFCNISYLENIPGIEIHPFREVGFHVLIPKGHYLAGRKTLCADDIRNEAVFIIRAPDGDKFMVALNNKLLTLGLQDTNLVCQRTEIIAHVASGQGLGLLPANFSAENYPNLISIPFQEDIAIHYAFAIHEKASGRVKRFVQEANLWNAAQRAAADSK